MVDLLGTRVAYESPWVRLREDRIRHPDGLEQIYAYVERPAFAIVAAVEDGHVWMVEQYRHPLKRRTFELPMGVAPGGDATPMEEAARIELREETGVVAETMTRVGAFTPAPGLLAQAGVVFLATGLTEGRQELEPTEQGLTARRAALADVLDRLGSDEAADGVTLAAFGLLRLKGAL